MKKFVCLFICLMLIVPALFSCGKNSDDEETTVAGNAPSDTKVSYSEKKDPDVDENGDFILTSTDSRLVYPYEDGYLVFKCSGDAVNKILRVIEFESDEKASEYTANNALDAIAKGETPDPLILNGNLVYYTVLDQSDDLMHYYSMTKTQIVSEFEEAE